MRVMGRRDLTNKKTKTIDDDDGDNDDSIRNSRDVINSPPNNMPRMYTGARQGCSSQAASDSQGQVSEHAMGSWKVLLLTVESNVLFS